MTVLLRFEVVQGAVILPQKRLLCTEKAIRSASSGEPQAEPGAEGSAAIG